MGRGPFFVAIVVCLFATAFPTPIIDLSGLINSLTQPIESVAGIVTGTVDQLANGVTSTVKAVTDVVTGLVKVAVTLPNVVTGVLSLNVTTGEAVVVKPIPGLNTKPSGLKNLTSGLATRVTSGITGLSNVTSGLTTGFSNVTNGLTKGLNNVTSGPTTGLNNVTSGLATGLNNVTSGLATGLNNVTSAVSGTITGLVQSLTDTLNKVTSSLDQTIESALGQPVEVVMSLLDSVVGSLNYGNISNVLSEALRPALQAVAGLVKLLPNTVGCMLSTAAGKIQSEIIKAVIETVKCTKPIVDEVRNASRQVLTVVADSADLATRTLDYITKCIATLASSKDIVKVIGCLLGPVGQGLSQVTGVVDHVAPIINEALNTALGVAQCEQKALANVLTKAAGLVSDIVKCAASKGIPVTQPQLPNSSPNFTAIASQALATIRDTFSSATGPNSPLNHLTMALQKLQDVVSTVTPPSVNTTVSNSVKGIQAAVDVIKQTVRGPSSPDVEACLTGAQKAITDLAAPVIGTALSCVESISPDVATLVAEAASLAIGLKVEAAEAGVNAYTKCSVFVTASDNSAEKCFANAIVDVKKYVTDIFAKINKAVETANNLIEKAEKCLANVMSQVDKGGQLIVSQLKQCVTIQGVQINIENISTEIIKGRDAIEKTASDLRASVDSLEPVFTNVKSADAFIASITLETVQSLALPAVMQAANAVLQVEEVLKSDNKDVKVCLDTSVERLMQLETTSIQPALDCVNRNKDKVKAIAAETAAEEISLNRKVSGAGLTAEAQCKTSVSVTAAQNCFVNFNTTLYIDVSQAVDRIQTLGDRTQDVLNETVDCVNNSANEAAVLVDRELASLRTCLAGQGVDMTISRA